MKYLKNKDIYKFKYTNNIKSFCVIQKIAEKLGVNKYTTTPEIKEKYQKFSYEGDVLPGLYQFTKSFPSLTPKLSKASFLKKKDFYLPSRTDEVIGKLLAIKEYLITKLEFTDKQATEALFLCPNISDTEINVAIKNIDFIKSIYKNQTKDIIIQYPNVLMAKPQNYNKILTIIESYVKHEGVKQEEILELIKSNPLLFAISESKLLKFLNVLNNHLLSAKKTSQSNINKAIFKREVDKDDIHKIKILGEKINQPVTLPVEEEVLKLKLFEFIKTNPYMFFTSTDNLEMMFKVFKEKLGVDSHLAFYLIVRCPDILYLNTHNLFEKKIDLLLKLDMDRFQVKHLIKHYPFMLVKSFSSYIKKYSFIKNDCGYKLNGDLDIYPLILIFDFNTEILPKLTILKKIEDFQNTVKSGLTRISDNDQKNKYFNSRLISVSRAFSLTKEKFCEEVNINLEEYDALIGQEDNNKSDLLFPNLQERDILFHYSKFKHV